MKNILGTINGRLNTYYKLYILREPLTVTANKWFKDKGDTTLRLNYPLTEQSIVFDVGGYRGDWADKIIKLYNPFIYIFEPVPEYYSLLVNRFYNNPKVKIYQFGLSNENKTENIGVLDDASSIYKQSDTNLLIDLRDVKYFLKEEKVEFINLIKINIEGGEYPLLNRMIEAEVIPKVQDIQVQFHNFYPDAEFRRENIRHSLSKTHFLTYEYPFIWENCSIKST
jgi:FkbM family methyltransferase